MNATNLTLALLCGGFFAAGVHLLMARSLVRVAMGVVLLGHAGNLLLLQAGGRAGEPPGSGTAPYEEHADPLPQALALTAIGITFAVLALQFPDARSLTPASTAVAAEPRYPRPADADLVNRCRL